MSHRYYFVLGYLIFLGLCSSCTDESPTQSAGAGGEEDMMGHTAVDDSGVSTGHSGDSAPSDGAVINGMDSSPNPDSDAGPGNEMPGPVPCTVDGAGDCECSGEPGFTTYTWVVDDQQRCFTIYTPNRPEPLPVMVQMDCYAQNRLGPGGCTPDSDLVEAAEHYGFVAVCASSTDGNWTFGNDGIINDDYPTPCSEDDSKDIVYLRGLLNTLTNLGSQGVLDSERMYAWGFSQNAMFAAYAAICFPDEIIGVWQGGSGLFVRGETDHSLRWKGRRRSVSRVR